MRFYFSPFENIYGCKCKQVSAGIGPGVEFGANVGLHFKNPRYQSIEYIGEKTDSNENGEELFFFGKNEPGYIWKNDNPVQG